MKLLSIYSKGNMSSEGKLEKVSNILRNAPTHKELTMIVIRELFSVFYLK